MIRGKAKINYEKDVLKYENDETERRKNAQKKYPKDSLIDINDKLAQLEPPIPTNGTGDNLAQLEPPIPTNGTGDNLAQLEPPIPTNGTGDNDSNNEGTEGTEGTEEEGTEGTEEEGTEGTEEEEDTWEHNAVINKQLRPYIDELKTKQKLLTPLTRPTPPNIDNIASLVPL